MNSRCPEVSAKVWALQGVGQDFKKSESSYIKYFAKKLGLRRVILAWVIIDIQVCEVIDKIVLDCSSF